MDQYSFKEIKQCEMCGSLTSGHKVLGQRLNQSQGLRPKKKTGITVSVIRCNNCNLIYSNPQPIPNDLQQHYGTPPEDYWIEEYFEWSPEYFSEQVAMAKDLLNFREGMTALDIGAGLGKAMKSMDAAGFDTYGLEPSIPFYERAISKMGIAEEKLKLGPVEELDYETGSFDFITFGAVFEHLYEPSKCLEKALKWLKPNGILHLEVPSSKWLMPKFMNFYYRLIGTNYVTNLSPMHPPYHLHEFDRKSFEKCSGKLGFKIQKIQYHVGTIYFLPGVFHPFFRAYMNATNTGMQLTVYLKKES